MRRATFWRIDNKPGAGWGCRIHVGRLQVGYFAFRHVYGKSPDRWVLQPSIIWDRKRVSS